MNRRFIAVLRDHWQSGKRERNRINPDRESGPFLAAPNSQTAESHTLCGPNHDLGCSVWQVYALVKHRPKAALVPGSTFFVFRQFPVQRRKTDVEQFRRFLFVAPGVCQGLVQVGQLLFAQERFKLSQRTIGTRICG